MSRLIVSMCLGFTGMEASNSVVDGGQGIERKRENGVYLKMENILEKLCLEELDYCPFSEPGLSR